MAASLARDSESNSTMRHFSRRAYPQSSAWADEKCAMRRPRDVRRRTRERARRGDRTADGSRLLAVNTADHRLKVFVLASGIAVWASSVVVGLEPVSVRALRGRARHPRAARFAFHPHQPYPRERAQAAPEPAACPSAAGESEAQRRRADRGTLNGSAPGGTCSGPAPAKSRARAGFRRGASPPTPPSRRPLNAVLLHAVAQVIAADTEGFGGAGLVPVVLLERLDDHRLLVVLQR